MTNPDQPRHAVYIKLGADVPDCCTRTMPGADGRVVNLDLANSVVVGVEVLDPSTVEVNGVDLLVSGGQPQPMVVAGVTYLPDDEEFCDDCAEGLAAHGHRDCPSQQPQPDTNPTPPDEFVANAEAWLNGYLRGAAGRGEPQDTPNPEPTSVDDLGWATWTGGGGRVIADPFNCHVFIPGKTLTPASARRHARRLLAAADFAEGGESRG